MSRKLTVQEQAAVVELGKRLGRILPSEHRGKAGGIASGLVRVRVDPIPAASVDDVLSRYGAGAPARKSLVRAGVLVPAYPEDAQPQGSPFKAPAYHLVIGDAGGTASQDAPGAEARAADLADGSEAKAAGGEGGAARGDAGSAACYAAAEPRRDARPGRGARRDARAHPASPTLDAAAPAPVAAHSATPTLEPGRPHGIRGLLAGAIAGARRRLGVGEGPRGALPRGSHGRAARLAEGPRPRAAIATSGQPEAKPLKRPARPAAAIKGATGPRASLGSGPRTLDEVPLDRSQSPAANDVRRKILDLDPRLWINGWLLAHPGAYTLYERRLRALDCALAGKTQLGDGTLTCRELSYQVFGDEKFLERDGDGSKLLKNVGLADIVRHRPQPKLGMLHHIPRLHDEMRIVVSENLDAWLAVRERMYVDGATRILGERVHGVVFGNGYLVNDAHKLPEFVEGLGAGRVQILYWGDIDRAGVQILGKLERAADGRFDVVPFTAAYEAMVHKAAARYPDPLSNEPAGQAGVPFDGIDALVAGMSERDAAYARAIVEHDLRIPQEIITRADL